MALQKLSGESIRVVLTKDMVEGRSQARRLPHARTPPPIASSATKPEEPVYLLSTG